MQGDINMVSIPRDIGVTASAAGLARQEQVPVILQAINTKGGIAQMREIKQAIETNRSETFKTRI